MTTTETTATMSLRVWPGCLSCYNAGRLVGAWIDAADAGELTVERLHQLAGAPLRVGCEEIWCLDGDGPWPGFHEMGLSEAQEWADAYAEVEPWLCPRSPRGSPAGRTWPLGTAPCPCPRTSSTTSTASSTRGPTSSSTGSPRPATWIAGPRRRRPTSTPRSSDATWRSTSQMMPSPSGGVYVFSNP